MMHIAVIGLSVIGKRHLNEVRSNTACCLAAAADPSIATAESAGGVGVNCCNDYIEMLVVERPDAANICTPNHLHLQTSLACISRHELAPLVGGHDAARTLEVILAVKRSALTGQLIELPHTTCKGH